MSQLSDSPTPLSRLRPDVFATGLNARSFVIGSACGVGLSMAMLAGVLALFNRPEWWGGFAVSAVGCLAGAVLATALVTSLFAKPLQTLMGGFLVAGILRAVLIGAVIVIAVRGAGYSDTATLVCSAWLYFTTVSIEGFLLWNMTNRPGSIRVEQPAGSPLTPTQDNVR